MDDERSTREILHGQIQDALIDGDELPDGSVLMGWVTIAECMDGEGERWLSSISGDARGEPAPVWQVEGYMHNMLFRTPSGGDDDD